MHVPVWHEATRPWVKQGRLVVLGVTQEQHADRCRLFAQWKRFDWPILHDPINLLEAPAVPIVVAIDEHGIVRADPTAPRDVCGRVPRQDLCRRRAAGFAALRRSPRYSFAPANRRSEPRRRRLAGGRRRADDLERREPARRRNRCLPRAACGWIPPTKTALFRLGVAHRIRHESPGRRPGDFQAAIDAWGRALELDPNQYIWRRRIEQYGPRLAKPYAFYDWIAQAKADISHRGEMPVPLTVEPYGSELAGPVRDVLAEDTAPAEPDPKGQIHRDATHLIDAEVSVVPARVRPGQAARVHITFRPNAAQTGHWNNESTPLRVWVAGAEGWTIAPRLLEAQQGRPARVG